MAFAAVEKHLIFRNVVVLLKGRNFIVKKNIAQKDVQEEHSKG